MPHLPTKLFAATLVFGFALAWAKPKAAPLPIPSGLDHECGAARPCRSKRSTIAAIAIGAGVIPVTAIRYYYRPYYYGYGYRPYWYWNRPYYRRYWW